MNLRPYPEYKESGVPWLGKVPRHWDIRRAKYLFQCIDIRSTTGAEELLTVSAKYGVVPRSSMKVTMFKAESYVGHKLCWPNDLVINSLWAWARGLGVAKQHGLVSSAYGVYRLKPRFEGYADYTHYLVRSANFHWELRIRSKGVWTSRLQLTDDAFLGAPIPLPSPEEAYGIVRYIRVMDHHISNFIHNRRRLIEALNEQKQAIINQAVTWGLNPDAPLKPSGIEWIGDIPEHWEVTTLGRLVETFKTGPFGSILHQSDYVPGGVPLVNPVHISNGRITPDKNCAVDNATCQRLREYALKEGDIVFSRRGELGRCALVHKSQAGWLIGTGSIRARPAPLAVECEYLISALQGRWVSDYLSLMSVGATMQSLNTAILSRLPLPLPPREEQMGIPSFIEYESNRVNVAIAQAQREIDLIREYRTRLISDVVTGKLDVRHLSADIDKDLAEPVDMDEGIDAAESLAPEDSDFLNETDQIEGE
jgi:type I restriction enzyme S subunit